LFTLGSFLNITEVAQCLSHVFILTKNGLGHILADFFTNSSGHPVGEVQKPGSKTRFSVTAWTIFFRIKIFNQLESGCHDC
jgi:hypothetical protein